MAVVEEVALSWEELEVGALGAVCLWRRLIYTLPSVASSIRWVGGLRRMVERVEVAQSRVWWGLMDCK